MANELFAAIEVENTVYGHFTLVSDPYARKSEHTTIIPLSATINLKPCDGKAAVTMPHSVLFAQMARDLCSCFK